MNLFWGQSQPHRLREQTCGFQDGGAGNGTDREFGVGRRKVLHLE